ncbi:TrkA-N domain protein [Halorubrum distributum JCM 9100]|uniref:TrkA-N domain protein n=6 Tax=Halorubrum distributum TaxID=29283 RepID=M0EQ49_9EURY|nr:MULTISPECIES: NAD-binding protein [Halorubrum distributum group]PHQ47482.1 potassium channel protein [Halorubrum sp. C3]ELZ32716.1 TrkA-N domain protein [Halorubrum terrestre JCM 10247]ELZ49926.1 TrkA-N domain protein [Halorubrum distributum JCM 9100]ELZ57021.1 TrkA-N domain protein [Halorubrum distributum JCM 10118]EMA58429.1 TrkA-N domain protein [Halorubrum litoreum JCM 13561]
MELTRDWVTVRASIALTFAVAILSILAGLAQIGGLGVSGPLAPLVPDFVRQTVGFTGTITGFSMLGSGFALKNGYRIGWYSTAVLLPLTAIQGLMQASILSFPLVALSVLSVPTLVINRGRFDRSYSPSPTQLAAGAALVTAVSYGTVGTYALRDQFNGAVTIVDAFYFTVVTASTVGYGDISPATDIARLFAVSSLVMNVAAFAVALGVLLTPAIEAQLSKALGKMTDRQIDLLDDHVLVLGYGDLTEPILEELDARDGVEYAVVTPDETAARRLAERDIPVFTADPSDVDPLERVNLAGARAVVAATEDDARDALAILTARQLNPDVRIVAAVTQRENVDKLRRAGADQVISPTTLGGHIIVDCAFGADSTDATEGVLDDIDLDD